MIVIIYFCYISIKKLKNKMNSTVKHYKNNSYYKKRITYLRKLPYKDKNLKELEKLMKRFFRERFNLRNNLTYNEISERLEKKKKYSDLAKKMSEAIYSQEKMDKKQMNILLDMFYSLLKESD